MPKSKSLKILIFGSGVAGLVLLATLYIASAPICPDYYTQAQVDASNCIIGANLGIGLGISASILIELTVLVTAFITNRKSKKR